MVESWRVSGGLDASDDGLQGDVREPLVHVTGEGLPEDPAGLTAPRPREDQPALLERAQELAAVDAAIAAAVTGAGRVAVVEGPPGIGKTSLLIEARARAAASGFLVLHARGSELESAYSFGVVRQLFEATLAQAEHSRREQLLAGAAGHAERLFGAGTAASNGPGSEDAAFALLHGLYWLAVNLADSEPVAIAIDDLQWSDAPSLRWIAYLARRIESVPILVMATVRPLASEDPLLTELLVDPATTLVRPNALSAPSVTELVRAELARDADDAFCAACHRASGGNPLLLRELLRTLAAEDVPPLSASIETVERVAPDAIARSVRLRLSRLPAATRRLAQAVAVLGDGAEREHAAVLAGLERMEAASAAATLAQIDLLGPEPPFSFVHPLVRNAVYESLRPEEREQEHARAAAMLAAAGASQAQVAAQVLVAPPQSVDRGVAILLEAGRAASREGGLESAVRYLRRVLEEPLADEERGELLLELADVEANVGAPTVTAHLREALSLLRDPERQAEASLALGHALYWSGEEEEGVEVLERALAHHPDVDVELRHRLEAELLVNATRLASHYERARERLARLDVSLDQGPGARMLLCAQAYHEAAGGGDAEHAAATALAALTAMSEDERARNYTAGCYVLLHTDRLDEGVRLLDAALADVRRRGGVFHFSSLSMTRAILHYARGALIDAEADGRAALEALPQRNVWFGPAGHGWLAQILVERGALEEATELLDVVEMTVAPDAFSRVPLLRARAVVEAARGDHQAALARALELGHLLSSFGHTNAAASYPPWRSLAALAHHALGEREEALVLAREETDLARSWGAPRTLGRALRTLGLIEGGGEGLELIREAVSVLGGSPARLEQAYALADLGAALRRGNRRTEARQRLREALELAERSGAMLLAEHAREELIASGARPRRHVLTGADSLTPSERRVAAMASEGLSNREIAQALFVTLRTVEMHLSNAFRKLDVSSRTQLPAALARGEPAAVV